ncbi:Serine/threonine-protein kinase toxin HipA [Baekduia alba]|uniref:type II toxin-antitoxin system HipA family toxin n=1 Tax=Baekduia alba TaxID=2997333 RepID=UPI00233FE462|nr:type II toxin-antitoxin system HipA family toxin [Baekduia alba]WCB96502.1 Serine/threonine-protein kinase toxin HipA [Baekduia alba]
MSLIVAWDGRQVGQLDQHSERSREFTYTYTDASRALSLSLPTTQTTFSAVESRPFFEALLPEGVVREQIAGQLKLPAGDSYGLLAALGRDCAGAIQIFETRRLSDTPSVAWLDADGMDQLIEDLPGRPLGLLAADGRLRLSLAGVQRKAVLVRDAGGRYGEPLNGMPTTHILKPQPKDDNYPAIAINEHFCMSLAARCGLGAAKVELATFADRPCLVVERFDRDLAAAPVRRRHQEDLCQALGITPDFKYQQRGWRLPSFAGVAQLLADHGARPGADRLAVAEATVFNLLVGNADAHAKNMSLLHEDGRVRLAPLYDVVSTAAYPELNQDLALGIGGAFTVEEIGPDAWARFASDLGLGARAFAARRAALAKRVQAEARTLRGEALRDGWHDPVIDTVISVVDERSAL